MMLRVIIRLIVPGLLMGIWVVVLMELLVRVIKHLLLLRRVHHVLRLWHHHTSHLHHHLALILELILAMVSPVRVLDLALLKLKVEHKLLVRVGKMASITEFAEFLCKTKNLSHRINLLTLKKVSALNGFVIFLTHLLILHLRLTLRKKCSLSLLLKLFFASRLLLFVFVLLVLTINHILRLWLKTHFLEFFHNFNQNVSIKGSIVLL